MRCLISIERVLVGFLVGLALAMPQARAELRGKVHMLVNSEASRADWRPVPLPGAYIAVFWSVTVPAPAVTNERGGSKCRASMPLFQVLSSVR